MNITPYLNPQAMPIDYKRYPPDWVERRARILARDGYCCQFCGVPQYAVGFRGHQGRFIPISSQALGDPSGFVYDNAGKGLSGTGQRITFKAAKAIAGEATKKDPSDAYSDRYIVVVLTVAHLDHDEENWKVPDERLAALCQHCHLIYDAEEKARRRALNNNRKEPLKWLT